MMAKKLNVAVFSQRSKFSINFITILYWWIWMKPASEQNVLACWSCIHHVLTHGGRHGQLIETSWIAHNLLHHRHRRHVLHNMGSPTSLDPDQTLRHRSMIVVIHGWESREGRVKDSLQKYPKVQGLSKVINTLIYRVLQRGRSYNRGF